MPPSGTPATSGSTDRGRRLQLVPLPNRDSTSWKTLAEIIEPLRQFGLDHPDERLMLTEIGSVESNSRPGRKAGFIAEMQDLFAQPGYEPFDTVAWFDLYHDGGGKRTATGGSGPATRRSTRSRPWPPIRCTAGRPVPRRPRPPLRRHRPAVARSCARDRLPPCRGHRPAAPTWCAATVRGSRRHPPARRRTSTIRHPPTPPT